jgi:hypothetical protein
MGLIAAPDAAARVRRRDRIQLRGRQRGCGSDGCGYQFASYTFVALLVGSGAGVTGLLRDRYFPRA